MLINTILASVPQRFFHWLLDQEIKLRIWLQHLILRQAVAQAFQKFILRHPRWAASLFDEYFLISKAEPLLIRYLQSAMPPTANELAAAWADQLGPTAPAWFSPRCLDTALAAADFLKYLEAELQNYKIISPTLSTSRMV